jgi:hypothetical protein
MTTPPPRPFPSPTTPAASVRHTADLFLSLLISCFFLSHGVIHVVC